MTPPHRPRKRFGQHFLVDMTVVEDILQIVAAKPTDKIVEIGPGHGVLTDSLARSGAELHLIELDRDLAQALEQRYADQPNVTIWQADALQFEFDSLGGPLRIVGNLPYNISTPLLFRVLDIRAVVPDMHFMLQKEVVDRMAASPGSKQFGRLTVMLQAFLHVHALFDVPPDAFSPPPNVVSSVVQLLPRPKTPDLATTETMRRIVATAFSQRRKTLRNSLKNEVDEAALTRADIDPANRPEQIGVEAWIALAQACVSAEEPGSTNTAASDKVR